MHYIYKKMNQIKIIYKNYWKLIKKKKYNQEWISYQKAIYSKTPTQIPSAQKNVYFNTMKK